MKTPEAPSTDDVHERHKFYGSLVGARECDNERITRLQQTVDHAHEEQIGMVNAVSDDLNGATEAIRSDLNSAHGAIRNDLGALKDEFYKRHTKLGDRVDDRVELSTHNALAERVFTAIDTKKEEVEAVIKSLEVRVVAVERFAAANKTSWGTAKWFAGSISGVAGFVMWTFISGVAGDINALKDSHENLDKVVDTLGDSFREYRKESNRVHGELRDQNTPTKQPSSGGLR